MDALFAPSHGVVKSVSENKDYKMLEMFSTLGELNATTPTYSSLGSSWATTVSRFTVISGSILQVIPGYTNNEVAGLQVGIGNKTIRCECAIPVSTGTIDLYFRKPVGLLNRNVSGFNAFGVLLKNNLGVLQSRFIRRIDGVSNALITTDTATGAWTNHSAIDPTKRFTVLAVDSGDELSLSIAGVTRKTAPGIVSSSDLSGQDYIGLVTKITTPKTSIYSMRIY